MSIPLALPLPFFFIYLFVKFIVILTIPFALGLIVRIRSQAADQRKIQLNQNSDKATPLPPSPDSDGEDKPEDSYWTRFKRWCSEHSLALALGLTFVAATLIYIYREDISNLIYGEKPSGEGKKESTSSPTEEERKLRILTLVEHTSEEVFFKPKESVNVKTFVQKCKNFTKIFKVMESYYDEKKELTPQDQKAKKTMNMFASKYSGLFIDPRATPEDLKEKTDYFKEQFAKESRYRDANFKRSLELLTQDKES